MWTDWRKSTTNSSKVLNRSGSRRLTLDIDGSVVSAGAKVKGARRGYNPRRRGARSYWPITAYEAQEGQIVRLMNRPGNVHDGAAAVDFIAALVKQVRAAVGKRRKLECRMDTAFFREDVLEVLDAAAVEYAVKVPFLPWLGLKQLAAQASWKRVDDRTSYSEVRMTLWGRERRIVLYRSHVPHRSSRNYQLDLFHPDCGHYAYSAIATNKTLTPRNLRHFLNGRGSHEKAYGELKSGFAFDCLPSLSEPANAAWQMLSVLAFNLSRSFSQLEGSRATLLASTHRRSFWWDGRRRPRVDRSICWEWTKTAGSPCSNSPRRSQAHTASTGSTTSRIGTASDSTIWSRSSHCAFSSSASARTAGPNEWSVFSPTTVGWTFLY